MVDVFLECLLAVQLDTISNLHLGRFFPLEKTENSREAEPPHDFSTHKAAREFLLYEEVLLHCVASEVIR